MRIGDDGYKQCTTCKERKLPIEFHVCRARVDGLNEKCKKCRNEYRMRPEIKLAKAANWRKNYLANIDTVRPLQALRQRKYAKERKAWKVAEYAADPEAVRAARNRQLRNWRAKNPEQTRAQFALRRCRENSGGENHTGKDVERLMILQKSKCAHPWCRSDLADKYHVDHIVPLALGGSNDWRNIQILCVSCNVVKGARHPIDFAQLNGFLV